MTLTDPRLLSAIGAVRKRALQSAALCCHCRLEIPAGAPYFQRSGKLWRNPDTGRMNCGLWHERCIGLAPSEDDGLEDCSDEREEPNARPSGSAMLELVAEALRPIVRQEIAATLPKRLVLSAPNRPDVEVSGEHEKFPTLLRLLHAGQNVYLGGSKGGGKTTAALRAASALGLRCFVQGPVYDPVELTGYRDANGRYVESELYRFATCQEPSCLLLDEIDRSAVKATVPLNMPLEQRVAVFPVGQVKIPETHRYVATGNTWGNGATLEYTAASKQDGALIDRFHARMEWGYDLALEARVATARAGEAFAKTACTATARIRANLEKHGLSHGWGPRAVFSLAERLLAGFTLSEALALSSLATLESDQRAKALEGLA